MIYVKVHKSRSEFVSVCDEELVGKEFREGKYCLKVSEYFYKGEKRSEREVKEILKNYAQLNIVGKRSIKLALELNIVDKDMIIKIDGVPHAQVIPC